MRGATREVLTGCHAERGILIVNRPDIALQHQGVDGQAFVYQASLAGRRLRQYAMNLGRQPEIASQFENQNMLTQSLINSFSRQLSTTLDHVAQDLPKFVTSTNLLGQTSIKPAQKESR